MSVLNSDCLADQNYKIISFPYAIEIEEWNLLKNCIVWKAAEIQVVVFPDGEGCRGTEASGIGVVLWGKRGWGLESKVVGAVQGTAWVFLCCGNEVRR